MESAVSVPRLAAAPLLCWPWTRVPLVSVHVGLEARPAAGLTSLLLFRLALAGRSLLAPAMPELILQMRLLSARCSFRMRDPPPRSAFIPLPGARVTNVATATR